MSAPVSTASRVERLTGIEALRAFAAIGVLTWHVWSHPTVGETYGVPMGPLTKLFENGRAGVAMFFVLSGFLLYRPFVAAVMRGTPFPSLRRYFINRALRILPAYWVVLLVVAACFQRGLLDRPVQLVANMLFLQDFIPNYVPGVFTGYGIAPAWSLCVEAAFYLCLPLLALAALGLRSRLAPTAAAAAPAAFMLVAGVFFLELPRFVPLGALWRIGFPEHMHWFSMGMLVAIVRVEYENDRVRLSRPLRIAISASAILLAALALKLNYVGDLTFEEEQSVFTVSCALLLALVVLPPARSYLVRALAWRPLVSLGVISYGIFLWHEPVLRALRAHDLTAGGATGVGVDIVMLFVLTVALASLSYFLVERPALSARSTFGERAKRDPVEWIESAP